ncbi:gluconate 2-dehydrogenase subunit 3-like protein [Maribacter caenipelagi]|uniref:Gluconate 2-dehydrogenase subunit 3-like protein n=1 Tax=Maribacter caenipelagi TaxID=1447781 RepID=A0A4R7DEP9_9FLAO|nr:gluconate 2-dehydrogenase subunit 3 family protein [Maribacter caenipelagi]TDS18815.1 gluconate 2-dehydrogenase subunit 3-like protein [Maribacter caenipelagi]|tara:strand:+ start:440 stop:1087 length:648 start_codon:yes stop_codon:yes gene_type:complete
MDRRRVLKNMGMSLGYMVATPTLLSIVQSCKSEPAITWTPEFLAQNEGSVLSKLVDIILPKTDTPSATEVQVDIFIDKFAKDVMETEQQDFLKMSMNKFIDKALADSGKEKAEDLTTEDLEPVIASSLKYTKEQQAEMFETINSYTKAISEGTTTEIGDEISRFAFANNLRGMTIWGYKASEYVGEEVLAYLPVPGEYVPCGDLQELTGGKAWSL